MRSARFQQPFRCRFQQGFGAVLAALLCILTGAPAIGGEVPAEAVLAVLPFLDSPEPNRIIVDLAPEGSAKPLRLMLDTGRPTAC